MAAIHIGSFLTPSKVMLLLAADQENCPGTAWRANDFYPLSGPFPILSVESLSNGEGKTYCKSSAISSVVLLLGARFVHVAFSLESHRKETTRILSKQVAFVLSLQK